MKYIIINSVLIHSYKMVTLVKKYVFNLSQQKQYKLSLIYFIDLYKTLKPHKLFNGYKYLN